MGKEWHTLLMNRANLMLFTDVAEVGVCTSIDVSWSHHILHRQKEENPHPQELHVV